MDANRFPGGVLLTLDTTTEARPIGTLVFDLALNGIFKSTNAGVPTYVQLQEQADPANPLIIEDGAAAQWGTTNNIQGLADGAGGIAWFQGLGAGEFNFGDGLPVSWGGLVQVITTLDGASGQLRYTGAGSIVMQAMPVSPTQLEDEAAGAGTLRSGSFGEYVLDVPDGVTGDLDFPGVQVKCEIMDVYLKKKGGAGGVADTIQVQTAAGAVVSDAMDINAAALGDIIRATNITEANATFAVADQIRVRRVQAAGDVACQVIIKYRTLS